MQNMFLVTRCRQDFQPNTVLPSFLPLVRMTSNEIFHMRFLCRPSYAFIIHNIIEKWPTYLSYPNVPSYDLVLFILPKRRISSNTDNQMRLFLIATIINDLCIVNFLWKTNKQLEFLMIDRARKNIENELLLIDFLIQLWISIFLHNYIHYASINE